MRTRAIVSLAVILAVSFLMSVAVHAEPNMQEGMWEIKGEMKLEGMPFPMPAVPISYTQCLTKKDMVPQQKEKNKECTTESTKVDGNTVTWAVKCKDKKGAVTESAGSVTYKGSGFDGKIHTVTTDAKGSKSESNLAMSGKRTGDCK
jgi:uncharacterized protein DUF3617